MAFLADIRTVSTSHYMIQGELSFETVHDLRQKGDALIKAVPKIEFDFSAVTRSDSSAMTLLLAWHRTAQKLRKRLIYTNLPTQLRDLIHLSNLDHFFSREGH